MQFYLKGLAVGIAEKSQRYAHRCNGSNPVSVNVQKTKFERKAGSPEPWQTHRLMVFIHLDTAGSKKFNRISVYIDGAGKSLKKDNPLQLIGFYCFWEQMGSEGTSIIENTINNCWKF